MLRDSCNVPVHGSQFWQRYLHVLKFLLSFGNHLWTVKSICQTETGLGFFGVLVPFAELKLVWIKPCKPGSIHSTA